MAERRMFSKRIINSARFLKMPISTQALYFHLGLNADDDGVVEAYTVIRSVGCTEDDLKVLVAKGFVQVLNDDLVSYITDWKENNKIRPDRKIDSVYKDLLVSINPDITLIERRERADVKRKKEESGRPVDVHWTTNGLPMDGIGKDSIGKDSIGKDSIYVPTEKSVETKPKSKKFIKPTVEEIRAYCTERKNGIDPEKFFDYYEANGWVQGKAGKPIKDWKAAVRTWERSGYNHGTASSQPVDDDIQKYESVINQFLY